MSTDKKTKRKKNKTRQLNNNNNNKKLVSMANHTAKDMTVIKDTDLTLRKQSLQVTT